jgi:hypothetical protein
VSFRLPIALASLVVLVLLVPLAAVAQTQPPRTDQYGNPIEEVVEEPVEEEASTEETTETPSEEDVEEVVAGTVENQSTPPTRADAVLDSLPFTGTNLAFVAAFGGALLAAGIALRWRRRAET